MPNFSKGILPTDYKPVNFNDLGDMIGKIAFQVIRNVTADDRLAVFKKMPVNKGDTIEQVMTKLAVSRAYDKEGANALTRKKPELIVRYFNNWERRTFETTIDMAEMRKVLLEGTGTERLSANIVSELSEGDTQEHYENLKLLLKNAKATGDGGTGDVMGSLVKFADVDYGTDDIKYKEILTDLKDMISKMSFVNATCNSAGLKRKTPKEDIVVLMPYSLKNKIDVGELSAVFNLDKAEIGKKIIEIDTEPEGNYQYIYVVDKNAILDFTRLYEMVDQKNADGLFWNYFLHVERLYGISPLFDAMYLKVQVKATV